MWRSLSAFLLLAIPFPAQAQQALTGTNTIEYSFAGFTADGFAPMPTAGQLDSDEWIATRVNARDFAFGETRTTGDFANGPSMGGETSGGIWAFGPLTTACSSTPRTFFGVQPSNRTFSPGSFQVRVLNSTGAPITAISLAYTLAWLNDENRSMVHGVQVLQVDPSGMETGSVMVPSLAFETPVALDAAAMWQSECRGATIDLASIPIADGDHFVVVFDVDDGTGFGSRDELGISDVRIGTMAITVDAGVPPLMDAGVAPDGGVASDGGVVPGTDGGVVPGTDGGVVPGTDGGVVPGTDGGVVPTMDGGGADGGGTLADGSTALDAGTGGSGDGCGCSTVGTSTHPAGWTLCLLGLVAWRRRQR